MSKEKLKHLGTIPLETDRLLLRPFKRGDTDAMFKNWASDPEVTKYLTWPHYTSRYEVQLKIDEWVSNYTKPDFYQWAILEKGSDDVIGTISVVDKNDLVRLAHIGYCIGRAFQGKGYMTEAFKRLIEFLFEDVGYNRIESRYDPNNPASGRVMQKAGLKFEGTMRQADWNNQGVCDTNMYAILKSDLAR
ncbi:MAG TPA: GNAT family N-acetyltransferase [Fastidiosipila sp.]|nr:GNAT family N-acetyltransferase [Fastidiosipila sp.]